MRKTQSTLIPPEQRGALSPARAAIYLDCSPRQLARLLASGELPSAKIGKLRRIRRVDLDAFLQAQMGTGGDDAA